MICPTCNVEMVRRPSKFKSNAYWWGCPNFQECRITSAEHPDGTIASTPCDEETKKLRQHAHKLSEKIWGKWDSSRCKKQEMYAWLKVNTKTGHFGHMEKEELTAVIEQLEVVLQYSWVR